MPIRHSAFDLYRLRRPHGGNGAMDDGSCDLDRIRRKMDFLVPERDAQMAMLSASRFTVGSVLEEQADTGPDAGADLPADLPVIDHESAFEAGLALILSGLVHRTGV
ncbi:hypothetical protein [Streptomyces sp.]|uniref:hypothetical protein n=1 Tax=Streptomyces sp. TaxID=1931 RepID=UPI0025D76BAD|nr:hypothetical protein [Streptomyces sp.]